jgi:hypothetical protein
VKKILSQKDHIISESKKAYKQGLTLVKEGKHFLGERKMKESEEKYRSSLDYFRLSLSWDESNIQPFKYIHFLGKIIHNNFSCSISPANGTYSMSCPVYLSHITSGFSVGMACERICSICGKDFNKCKHEKWKYYDNIEAKKIEDQCNICGEKECNHKIGEKYDDVTPHVIVKALEAPEISLVDYPQNPYCTIQVMQLTRSEVNSMLGDDQKDDFVYGKTTFQCHHCFYCKGDDLKLRFPLINHH